MSETTNPELLIALNKKTLGGWHVLHMILCFCTFGLWFPFWLIHAALVGNANAHQEKSIRGATGLPPAKKTLLTKIGIGIAVLYGLGVLAAILGLF